MKHLLGFGCSIITGGGWANCSVCVCVCVCVCMCVWARETQRARDRHWETESRVILPPWSSQNTCSPVCVSEPSCGSHHPLAFSDVTQMTKARRIWTLVKTSVTHSLQRQHTEIKIPRIHDPSQSSGKSHLSPDLKDECVSPPQPWTGLRAELWSSCMRRVTLNYERLLLMMGIKRVCSHHAVSSSSPLTFLNFPSEYPKADSSRERQGGVYVWQLCWRWGGQWGWALGNASPGLVLCAWCMDVCVCCRSVTKSCPALCNPMDCSMPDFPVLHYLMEFAQIHVHWVGDSI